MCSCAVALLDGLLLSSVVLCCLFWSCTVLCGLAKCRRVLSGLVRSFVVLGSCSLVRFSSVSWMLCLVTNIFIVLQLFWCHIWSLWFPLVFAVSASLDVLWFLWCTVVFLISSGLCGVRWSLWCSLVYSLWWLTKIVVLNSCFILVQLPNHLGEHFK